jgi:hypothetical protein
VAAPLRIPPVTERSRSSTPTRPPVRDDHPHRREALLATAAVAAVLALTYLGVTQLFGGDDKSDPTSATTVPGATTPSATTPQGTPSRSRIVVAVLNGTTVAGLARTTADRIQQAGYRRGTVADAADQQRSATVVSYAPGHRREALAIARIVKVGRDAVEPIDPTTQAVAGPRATVVVTVGADRTQ